MNGIPYTISEVRKVIAEHKMDPYHRDIMKFLLEQIAAEREACARLAECRIEDTPYYILGGKEVAMKIRLERGRWDVDGSTITSQQAAD